MSDVKISGLPSSTGVAPASDYIPIVHNGTTEKITPNELIGGLGLATDAELAAGLATKADVLNPVPSYPTTASIPAPYTGVARVGTNLYVGDGVNLSKEVSSVYLLEGNTAAIALANFNAIQNAINLKGNVFIDLQGKTYYSNFGFNIKSDTRLIIGVGELTQYALPSYATTSKSFLTNSNFESTAVVTTTDITAVTVGTASGLATLTFSAGVLPIDNETGITTTSGGYIEVTGDSSMYWNSVYKVATVNNTAGTVSGIPPYSLTFICDAYNTASSTGNYLRVACANSNIIVTGGATINHNSPNTTNPTSGTSIGSNLGGHVNVFNRISKLYVNNISIVDSPNYAFEINNIFDSTFRDIYVSDCKAGIQCEGPFKNILIDGIFGNTYDDLFAFLSGFNTLYSTITSVDWYYPLNGQLNNTGVLNKTLMMGVGLIIKNIKVNGLGYGHSFLIAPDQISGGFSDISISDISSTVTSEISVNTGFNSTLSSYLNDITISKATNVVFIIQQLVTVEQISISNYNSGSSSVTNGIGPADGDNAVISLRGSVGSLKVSDSTCYLRGATLQTPFITVSSATGTPTIGTVTLDNVNLYANIGSQGCSLLKLNATANINTVNIINGKFTGALAIGVVAANSASLKYLNITNWSFSGLYLTDSQTATTYNLNNIDIIAATSTDAGFFQFYMSGGPWTINAKNIYCTASNLSFIYANGVSTRVLNANLDNINFASGCKVFRDSGTSNTWNINVNGVSSTATGWGAYGTTPTINWTNPDGTLSVDLTKLARKQASLAKPIANTGTGSATDILLGNIAICDGTNTTGSWKQLSAPTTRVY